MTLSTIALYDPEFVHPVTPLPYNSFTLSPFAIIPVCTVLFSSILYYDYYSLNLISLFQMMH
jgi:hypothetical protein